ncbi:MAG: HesA/MoeB/ThiF family protein [Clostridiaceae bacterium]
MERYKRNESALSKKENLSLRDKKVCIVGCGGLGGYIIEMLSRLGVGNLTLVDGDKFEVSNLNRQLLSTPLNLGTSKAKAASDRVSLINPEVNVVVYDVFLDKSNARRIIEGNDLVIDALDGKEARLILEDQCEESGIPLIHGAIGGWYGQVGVIYPGSRILHQVYEGKAEKGIEEKLGNPAFTPALIASIEVSEAVKVLVGRETELKNKLLFIDILNNEFITVDRN